MIDWTNIKGFDWDSGNVRKSNQKHGVSCEEAESVFAFPLVLPDAAHSQPNELRMHAFGLSSAGRPLAVTFTVRHQKIRIISARAMNKRERKTYEFE
jgi:uncharacterized DUF497 family protein